MVIKVIGKERKVGTFQGNAYDNTSLYCMEELNSQNLHDGFKTHELKVKARVKPYDELVVGDYYEVYYDEYRNVAHLNKITRKEEKV